MEAGLGPGEDPGDGAQVVDRAGGLALGGAAADVHAAQLVDGRGRLEELDEARVPPHHTPVRRARRLRAHAQGTPSADRICHLHVREHEGAIFWEGSMKLLNVIIG